MLKYDVAQIEHERRTGYEWYVDSAEKLLKKDYPAWKKQQMSSRREFIRELLAGGALIAVAPRLSAFAAEENPWETVMPSIVKRIKRPRFPMRKFDLNGFWSER